MPTDDPKLGQEWVTKVTQSNDLEVSVMGGQGSAMPLTEAEWLARYKRRFMEVCEMTEEQAVFRCRTATDEAIEVWLTAQAIVEASLVPNLHWLLALATDPCCQLPIVIEDAATMHPTDVWESFEAVSVAPMTVERDAAIHVASEAP